MEQQATGRTNNMQQQQPVLRAAFYTVRLAIKTEDTALSAARTHVHATSADHAADVAVMAMERETGLTGWVLDGPVVTHWTEVCR